MSAFVALDCGFSWVAEKPRRVAGQFGERWFPTRSALKGNFHPNLHAYKGLVNPNAQRLMFAVSIKRFSLFEQAEDLCLGGQCDCQKIKDVDE